MATDIPPIALPDYAAAARGAVDRIVEETIRDFMRMWKEQGRVLEPDSPLRPYWPADEGGRRA